MSFTTRTVQYIPFRETSFGFGSGAVAAAQTQLNPTDIVRVDINTLSGSNFSDLRDGHISTPSVGTAISVFNGFNNIWTVRGELADVDAVLAQLSYFPSDYETTRTWTPTALKDNQTSGVFFPTTGTGGEEPPAIPDDDFQIKIYDSNNQSLQSNIITFEAHQYDYGNSRPYWSVEPVVEDVSGGSTYNHIDLGTIANTPAEENVTLTCEFRNYGSTSTYTGSAYGYFSQSNRFYVSDKIEGTRNTTDARFNFTGSLTEAQTFLDNIRYNRSGNRQAFDMFLKISDGVVGSTVTKTCWHSDSPFTVSHQLPDLAGTEEESILGLNPDPNFTITHSPEVNRYWYTITLDATGQDGITYMSDGTLSNGVYTSDYITSITSLRARLQTLVMSFRDDFNDDFTFTIQWHGDNTTIGSSYSSAIQTVNVTMTDTSEFSNLFTAHSFSEDSRYTFSDGAGLPNIAHGYNRNYTARITASDPNAVELIWTEASGYTGGTDFFWENGNQLRMVGTRDQVNEMLNGVYFEPATDYDQNFSFSYKQTRLSGDTTSDAAERDYYNVEIGVSNCISMTCAVSHDEYSFTASTQNWDEDVSKIFDTGIRVTDLSDEHEWTTSYGTTYTVYMKMVDSSGNDFNEGSLTSTSTGGAQGNLGGSNPKSYTGTKAQVNQAITNMKYIPQPDGETGFWIQFKIVRDFDGAVLADYSDTRQITFNTPTTHEETTATNTTISSWNKNVNVVFDSGLRITDLSSENPDFTQLYNGQYRFEARVVTRNDNDYVEDGYIDDYVVTYQSVFIHYGNQGDLIANTDTSGLATWSGTGTFGDPRVAVGTRSQINDVMSNLKFIPPVDFTSTTSDGGGFTIEYRLERVGDSTVYYDWSHHTEFPAGIDDGMYSEPTNAKNWTQDVAQTFDTDLSILDMATENPYYTHYNGYYRVTGRAKNSGGNLDETHGTFFYTDVGSATVTGNGTTAIPLEITGSKSDINTALDNLRFVPYPEVDDSFWFEWKVERLHDSVVFVYYGTSTSFTAATPTSNFDNNWGNVLNHSYRINYGEDVQQQAIFSHVGSFVEDLAPNNFTDMTYDVTFDFRRNSSVVTDEFEFNLSGYTTGPSLTITNQTKDQMNALIPQITVSPTDGDLVITGPSNALYVTATSTIKKNGSVTTTTNPVGVAYLHTSPQHDEVTVGGTQYAVSNSAVPVTQGVVFTPRYLTEQRGLSYSRPISINDLYERGGDSVYKITLTVPSGLTLYDSNGEITNGIIDWSSKTTIHSRLNSGIRVMGATADFSLPFTVRRRTYDGTEEDIFTGNINYTYLFEPALYQQTYYNDNVNAYPTATYRQLNTTDTVYGILDPTLSSSVVTPTDNFPVNGDNNFATYNRGASINLMVDDDVGTGIFPSGFSATHYVVDRVETSYNKSEQGSWGNAGVVGLKIFPLKQNGSEYNYTSATVTQQTVTLVTTWGTKVDYTLDFNWTWTHPTADVTQTLFPTGTDSDLMKQSNYWDGTYMCVNNVAIDLNGNKLNVGDNRSKRFATNYFYDDDAYDRALVNGPQGYFFGFRAIETSGDVKIVTEALTSPTGSTVSVVPDYTLKTGYSVDFNGEEVGVTQVIYDSTNDDVYVLTMLQTPSNTKHAIIAKLDYNGSSYTWSTVKDIQLLASNEHYAIEAHLSNDITRLITVQNQYSDSTEQTLTSTGRVRVYDKDTGGTDVWGLTTTTNRGGVLTKKRYNWHDVNYCDINSDATVLITRLGQIFKKDEGGTDNWGHEGYLENFYASTDEIFCKFTQDYLISVRAVDIYYSSDYFRVWDADTLSELSSRMEVQEGGGAVFTLMVEASKEHNVVGLYLRETGSSPDPENYTYKLYQLTT